MLNVIREQMTFRNPQGIHRLSVAAIKFIADPGWHSDGGGLYLEVDKNGRKRWAMRLTVAGRRRDFGLGPLHKVTLQQARERAADYRTKAYQGVDPVAEKKITMIEVIVPTFEEAARQVHTERKGIWSNGKHVDQWINTLIEYAFPTIGKKPVSDIKTSDVLEVLAPIWTSKKETARRVKQRLAVVLDWARAAGHRSGDNPVELIGDALPRHPKADRHHAALAYGDVPKFIQQLRAGRAVASTKCAFEFLILTAARTIEVRFATWDEIDLASATWTIPGNNAATGRRMKSGRDHSVPLSARAIEILRGMGKSTKNQLVFPDPHTGKAMSENRFLIARDALGYTKAQCTPHGFRSSFRDWAAEETNFPSEVVEMALAHAIKNKTEAAYRRGHLMQKRKELMTAWANHVLADH